MAFKKAERKQAKLRLALCGSSGSGKTRGAILIAKGLGGKIAMIDTERGSGSLYSHLGDYDVSEFSEPFTPQKFVHEIKQAESMGYNVLIIDSLSHAWSGTGGVLDMHDNAARASKSKNSFLAWREVTPQHNKLVDTILQSKMHIIVCMRTKTSYEIVEEDGKKVPVKIGLAPVQREGLDYEFTVVLDLQHDSHLYTSSKDRTEIFDGKHELITEKTGKDLLEWLNSGQEQVEEEKEERAEPLTVEQVLHDISKARDMNTLKNIYSIFFMSTLANDKASWRMVNEAKDKRKAELLSKTQNKEAVEFMEENNYERVQTVSKAV